MSRGQTCNIDAAFMRKRRNDLGYSGTDFAKLIGTSGAYISQIEMRQDKLAPSQIEKGLKTGTKPTLMLTLRIAAGLQVPVRKLIANYDQLKIDDPYVWQILEAESLNFENGKALGNMAVQPVKLESAKNKNMSYNDMAILLGRNAFRKIRILSLTYDIPEDEIYRSFIEHSLELYERVYGDIELNTSTDNKTKEAVKAVETAKPEELEKTKEEIEKDSDTSEKQDNNNMSKPDPDNNAKNSQGTFNWEE